MKRKWGFPDQAAMYALVGFVWITFASAILYSKAQAHDEAIDVAVAATASASSLDVSR